MGANSNASPARELQSIEPASEVMAAINSNQRVVVNGFEAILESDKTAAGKLLEPGHFFFVYAVRTGAYRQADNIRMMKRAFIERHERREGGRGTREGWEGDDELLAAIAATQSGDG